MICITMTLSRTEEGLRRFLRASSMMERPLVRPDSGVRLYLNNFAIKGDFSMLYYNLRLPFRAFRIVTAVSLVLFSQSVELLLVTTWLEHLIRPFFIERAAHPLVCRLHCEDC